MGTVFSFDVRDPVTPAVRRALAESVAWLHHVDEVFSTYRPDSVISRLGRGEMPRRRCGPEVAEVLRLCEEAERASGGWFSPTAGGRLDPSGLVKGWAVDRASDLLYEAGAHRTCVNGGGDVRLRGEPAPGVPWRIGIADPSRPGWLMAVVTGRDCAVATSGTAERGHHVLDPHTGEAATDLLSLTLTGPGLTLTDACATAAFAMGDAARAWTTSLPGHEALAMTGTGHVWRTPGFPGGQVTGPGRESGRTPGPASPPRSYT
ncbi:FAD:protein FMN transferase [Streptomyces sulfonofaciens]|uniref:FAD:protein FMN transferase n=1 Tax=Streptomyces sulfonofaciens TaxID=68272 RepID=A0A919KX93_9ACTN|nr:FAD:protein FMN transferase [Streptomyces sulfonofaciens]GHH75251.1 FAD:protein FMN transferase [Streptomyces sulfonofaciens]